MSGKNSHGAGVQRAIFRRMWGLLIALIVAETLRAIFSRKELMDCGGKEFVDPGKVDSFLNWAVRQEKLSKFNGADGTYRANVSPIHYLPPKVQPYLQDKGLLDVATKLLARIADPTTKILGVGDVELAFSTIHDDIELSTKQALIILAHLVAIGVLQDVGENQYLIIQQGGSSVQADEDSGDEVKEEPVAEASASDEAVEPERVEPFVAQPDPPTTVVPPRPSEEDVALSPTGHVSATNRMRMLQLFAKTRGRIFKANAKERARELGYVSGSAFTMALCSLHRACWIRPEANRRGWWRWNIENVPVEWCEAYGYSTAARSVVPKTEAMEVNESIPVVVAEEPAVQVPTVDPVPIQVVAVDAPEEAQPPQPDLAEQLAQTHRQLEEQGGVNDLLTRTVVEMMYGYMCYMSKDLQLRILGGLAVKIKG